MPTHVEFGHTFYFIDNNESPIAGKIIKRYKKHIIITTIYGTERSILKKNIDYDKSRLDPNTLQEI
ncbi:MAG: hypothetical protein GY804_09275 [Alphaproteobacteria bacterium]|nr:hypothetical protein [Alphaproteobacteria bacterium]